MTEARGYVEGEHNEHEVMLCALSTCIWCRKMREFLEAEGIAFNFVYVDLLDGEERDAVKAEVRQWNPRASFPTVVIDGGEHCVVGAKTDSVKEVLGL